MIKNTLQFQHLVDMPDLDEQNKRLVASCSVANNGENDNINSTNVVHINLEHYTNLADIKCRLDAINGFITYSWSSIPDPNNVHTNLRVLFGGNIYKPSGKYINHNKLLSMIKDLNIWGWSWAFIPA